MRNIEICSLLNRWRAKVLLFESVDYQENCSIWVNPSWITEMRRRLSVKLSQTFLNERFRKVFSFPMYPFGDKKKPF